MKRRYKFAVIFVMLAAGFVAAAPSLAEFLIVERPLEHADAILVLSGSAAYKERTKKAAELYTKGVSPRVFVTDDGERSGWNRTERTNLPYVELERRELIAGGVPAAAITVLACSDSGTDQEAMALRSEIEVHPLGSVLIVTSAYHTRRALRTFEKLIAGKGVSIGIEHAPTDNDSPPPDFWWLHPKGWTAVAGEYVKSAVYWLFY